MTNLCATCKHLPHPDRACRVKRVDGPASSEGCKVGDDYEHTGRTVTQCPCATYTPELNGAQK
jgi:hypothetical protein